MKEPKFKINQHVWYNGKTYYVRGFFVASQCYPDLTYEYLLSDKHNTTSTTNETNASAEEKDIITVEESCRIDIKEIVHFYGGWDEFKKVVAQLEENDNEAAFERRNTDY